MGSGYWLLSLCTLSFGQTIMHNCSINDLQQLKTFISQQTNQEDRPVLKPGHVVQIKLVIVDIYGLDETSGRVKMMVMAKLRWLNPGFTPECNFKYPLVLRAEAVVNVWKPLLSLLTTKGTKVVQSPDANSQLAINAGGAFVWQTELEISAACSLDLVWFPFDTSYCSLFVNPARQEYDIQWVNISVDIAMSRLATHWVKQPKLDYNMDCSQSTWDNELLFVIELQRYFTYYVLAAFIPNMLVLFIAWLGFYIDPKSPPARVSISISSLIILSIQSSILNANITKVGYIKVIDVWMLMCAFFITSTLVEFAVISYMQRKAAATCSKTLGKVNLLCSKLDENCTICYPIMVLCATVAYFVVCIIFSND